MEKFSYKIWTLSLSVCACVCFVCVRVCVLCVCVHDGEVVVLKRGGWGAQKRKNKCDEEILILITQQNST